MFIKNLHVNKIYEFLHFVLASSLQMTENLFSRNYAMFSYKRVVSQELVLHTRELFPTVGTQAD